MKHIALLTAFYSPFKSGAEAMPEEVPKVLYNQYTFTIITARLTRKVPKTEVLTGGVTVQRIGFGLWIDKWLYPWLAAKAVRKLQPDMVHANLESFAGMAMLKIKKHQPSLPTVLTCQSTNTTYRGLFSSLKLIKKMHRIADAITVLSTALQRRANEMGRTDAVLIPNGVHIHAVPERKPVFGRIVFAGRLEPMKGIDTLLKAMQHLPSHAHLRIIGSGSLQKKLQIQASMLNITDRVTFVGQRTHNQVLEEMAEAEVFCGLSRTEAFGNVFIEALATKCAVVATNVDGIPDIITHEHNGLLVPPDDPELAAQALKRVLDDEQLRAKLVEAGQQTVHRFDWRTIAEQYNQVYKRLV